MDLSMQVQPQSIPKGKISISQLESSGVDTNKAKIEFNALCLYSTATGCFMLMLHCYLEPRTSFHHSNHNKANAI
jgi:hypothetical protein